MTALAAVGGGDDVAGPGPPRLDHSVDRARREIGAVGQHDYRRFGLRRERLKAAAQ